MRSPIPIGSVFTRWTVLGDMPDDATRMLCECACGGSGAVQKYKLRSGGSKSCGCLRLDVIRTRGGEPSVSGYTNWRGMIQRCCDPGNSSFYKYGARGVTVCGVWRNSFPAFIAAMGPRPSPAYSLDRHPNMNGNYEPGNVRWATLTQQARNKHSNRRVVFNGESIVVADLADRFALPPKTLLYRLNAGWSVERAASQPVRALVGKGATA